MTEEEEEKLARLEKRLVATSMTKLATYWVLAQIFTRCWDTYVGLNKWFPMSILGNCLVFKREPQNKWMCMEAHWKVFGV
jgi:hypothetical protein